MFLDGNDGSLRYGYRNTYRAGIFRKRYAQLLSEDLDHVRKGTTGWAVWGPGANMVPQLADFETFINFWRARGTAVVVLNMPVDTILADEWEKSPSFESYRKFRSWDIGAQITKLGAYYFDFS